MAKKIVITGSSGFIGSKLLTYMVNQGYEVLPIDKKDGINIKYGITSFFKDVDTVFHLAATTSLPECQAKPKDAYENNVLGTVNILEAARRNDVRRVVFSSSSAVYEGTIAIPASIEREYLYPRLIYPMTKASAELACRGYAKTYGMDVVILRYCNVYGYGANSTRKNPPYFIYLINKLINGERPVIYANEYSKRDYVYVDDVVDVNYLVMEERKANNQTFNITTEECLTARQILKIINNALGTDIEPIVQHPTLYWSKYDELYEGRKILDYIVQCEVNKLCNSNGTYIYNRLGWRPKVSFKKGINKIIKEMEIG